MRAVASKRCAVDDESQETGEGGDPLQDLSFNRSADRGWDMYFSFDDGPGFGGDVTG